MSQSVRQSASFLARTHACTCANCSAAMQASRARGEQSDLNDEDDADDKVAAGQ